MTPTPSSSAVLTIPLTAEAHQQALRFAAAQANLATGKQAYFKTLAVWAVQRYLSWLHLPSAWAVSDSGRPETQALLGVADLILPALGRLECCPLWPGEAAIALPTEALTDRVGYVVVQIGEAEGDEQGELNAVHLLGFAPASAVNVEAGMLDLRSLQPLDQFPDYLYNLKSKPLVHPQQLVNLSNWLQHQFEPEWQKVETLLGCSALVWAFRQTVVVRRAKRLQGWSDQGDLALIVTLLAEHAESFIVHVQVCAVDASASLPSGLRLCILTDAGEVFQEVIAAEMDMFIQYEFTAMVGESFQLELVGERQQSIERFAI